MPSSSTTYVLFLFSSECKECFERIIPSGAIPPDETTDEAPLNDFPTVPERLQSEWFHETTAPSRPIARLNIDVPAIETVWTMIGKPVPLDCEPAVSADEVLRASLETPGREL
jgi:hypothetical protein